MVYQKAILRAVIKEYDEFIAYVKTLSIEEVIEMSHEIYVKQTIYKLIKRKKFRDRKECEALFKLVICNNDNLLDEFYRICKYRDSSMIYKRINEYTNNMLLMYYIAEVMR